MTERVIVDARLLEPPEPMIRTLDAVDTLAPGEKMLLIIHREPFPLYDILERNGFLHQTSSRADGAFEIRIWKA